MHLVEGDGDGFLDLFLQFLVALDRF